MLKKQTKKYDPTLVVVNDRMQYHNLFTIMHEVLNRHNEVKVRTMIKLGNMQTIRAACDLMRSLGYVKEIKEREVVTEEGKSGDLINVQFEVELISKHQKFLDE